ncbi:amino acid transporter [Pelomyxa schiedti]|nr:amino acid transporter [Pelomyxa schiedti]
MTVNYIIGIGSFGVPYAFFIGGIAMTLIFLTGSVGLMMITGFYVLEVMARATGVDAANAACKTGTLTQENGDLLQTKHAPKNNLGFEKYDYARFCEVFAGKWGKVFALVCLCLYCYGILWAYASTFGSSLAMLIWQIFIRTETCDVSLSPSTDCMTTYYCCILGLAICGIPLSLLEVTSQWALQFGLTLYRFFAFSVMAVTCAINLGVAGPMDNQYVWGFKWSGFAVSFTSTIIAQTMHYNLASAVTPVKDKRYLRRIVVFAEATAFFFNVMVGIICAVNFNSTTHSLIVLNWATYTGRHGGWGAGSTLWWAYIIQALVLIFPVINIFSNFPLVCITVGNNMHTFIPTTWYPRFGGVKVTRGICRAIAAIPPIIAAAILGDLSVIFTVTGLFGFFLVFFIPSAFNLLSKVYMSKHNLRVKTPYTGWYSHRVVIILVLLIGVCAFLFALIDACKPSLFS